MQGGTCRLVITLAIGSVIPLFYYLEYIWKVLKSIYIPVSQANNVCSHYNLIFDHLIYLLYIRFSYLNVFEKLIQS